MRPTAPLDFPGGRQVAGWWKQLAPLRPQTLWIAHLLIHRVEALVRSSRSVPLEDLTRLVLEALAPGLTPAGLAARLAVSQVVARRLLQQLQADELTQANADGSWTLTALARHALAQGSYTRLEHERRAFAFVENEAGQPPHFLNLLAPADSPALVGPDWTFDVSQLRECVRNSADWKQRHGFPLDVLEIADSPDPAGPPWQAVVLDRPTSLPVALVQVSGDEGARLHGYALEPAGWTLHARQALFKVAGEWSPVFPDLVNEPTPEQWHEAWHAWCQRRGLPTVEADASLLERHEHRVCVRGPARLLDRLRAARSEALKGEAWLLAGTGRVRRAAQLEVRS